MENLKDFIQKNKNEFDSLDPSVKLWEEVEKKLDNPKPGIRILKLRYWSAAASVLLLLGLGFIIGTTIKKQPVTKVLANETIEIGSLKDLSQELEEVENHYIHQVSEKLTALQSFNPDESTMEEYNELETEFNALKSELGKNIDNERIVEEMIENYQLKVELLEYLLIQFESLNKEKNEIQIIEL